MPEIRPFPGLLFRVPQEDLSRVLAPPYDVISPAKQEELYARDPRNIVRVILNRTPGEAGYAEAGETFRRLLAEGVLAPDPEPALYLLEQGFALGERRLRRYGLLARFRAEDPEHGGILPHEQTRRAAREDRYRLLRATRANFSPIFLFFRDTGRFSARVAGVIGGPAALTYTDDGDVRHRVWRIADPQVVEAFRLALSGATAYIADGHHRYATALRHRDDVGPDGAWTLGYFTPMDAPGLVVLPYHRILSEGPSLGEARKALEAGFRLADAKDAAEAASRVERSRAPHAFALAAPGGGALLAEALPSAPPAPEPEAPACLRALDAWLLHEVVLPRLLGVGDDAVGFVHSLSEVESALAEARCRLGVLMRPTPVAQVVAVADARESMPPKSTFFHPKLPSGLVVHPLVA